MTSGRDESEAFTAQRTGDAEAESVSDGYSKLGEHVASVLEAAERAAKQLTEEARSSAVSLRERSQREAEELLAAAKSEAETLLRTAQQEGDRRAQAAQERSRILEENVAATEQRLKQLTTGLRELASLLDALVDADRGEEETLEASLRPSVAGQRAAQESPDVPS